MRLAEVTYNTGKDRLMIQQNLNPYIQITVTFYFLIKFIHRFPFLYICFKISVHGRLFSVLGVSNNSWVLSKIHPLFKSRKGILICILLISSYLHIQCNLPNYYHVQSSRVCDSRGFNCTNPIFWIGDWVCVWWAVRKIW